uniref:Nuclear pore complex protein n=1 Tax=Tetraodon nigroviridis TaxID=99883 RepID=H3DPY3_TETNG
QEKMNHYERAICATLSGNLKPILVVCESWEDCVWAHFKVTVDSLVEKELMSSGMANKVAEMLPREYQEANWTMEKVFEELQASESKRVLEETKEHDHIIQKFAILGDLDGQTCTWRNISPDDHPSHTGNLFQVCKTSSPIGSQPLSPSPFLETVTQAEIRPRCLQLATDAGLDVAAITKLVVETVRERDESHCTHQPDAGDGNHQGTSNHDLKKTDIIDWLLFDPAHRAEALKQSNAITRKFLALQKQDAAEMVFSKVPEGSTKGVSHQWAGVGQTTVPAEDENAIREHLCIRAYLEAHEAFTEWFSHSSSAAQKPAPVPQVKFTEKVANEIRQKEYEVSTQFRLSRLDGLTVDLKERIYDVLLFVDGSWIAKLFQDSEQDSKRSHQMAVLGSLAPPRLVSLLLSACCRT